MIMQWLVYVYMLNGLASSAYNLLLGGSFLRHLLRIREFSLVDRSRRLACLLIGSDLAVVLAIKAGVIWAYQWNDVQTILFGGEGDSDDPFRQFLRLFTTVRFGLEAALSILQTLFLTLNTLLFVYSMTMFRWAVEQLQADVKRGKYLKKYYFNCFTKLLYFFSKRSGRTATILTKNSPLPPQQSL